jgi:hypothetical protein
MNARRWAVVGALGLLAVVAVGMRRKATATTEYGIGGASATADLYLPAARGSLPLVVLLQPNDGDSAVFAATVGDAMQRRGNAALAVSFRLSDDPKTTAAGVARLIADVDKEHHFARVAFVGRDVGGWLAATLALDRSFAGIDPKRIGAVVGIRGSYELDRLPSPATLASAESPPFLLLTAARDVERSHPRLARSFAHALAQRGVHAESLVIPFRDPFGLVHWAGEGNDLGELVTSFLGSGPKALPPDTMLGARQRWSDEPPLDNADLRADRARIQSHPVDEAFVATLMVMFDRAPYEIDSLPGKTFEAFDLVDYLAARSDIGTGDHLVVTNMRGEQSYFTRTELEATKPLVVVGMDDETNLNRLFTPYRLKTDYTWKPSKEPMPTMMRPLGAFLHFRSPPPAHLRNKSFAPYGLTAKSFRWTADDPLARVRDLSGNLRDVILGEQGCLKCHSFRGAGARAHHVTARDGTSHGAFALPLEEYPTDVLRRFLFDQDAVARSFDVAPLRVDRATAESLFDLVTREKK